MLFNADNYLEKATQLWLKQVSIQELMFDSKSVFNNNKLINGGVKWKHVCAVRGGYVKKCRQLFEREKMEGK